MNYRTTRIYCRSLELIDQVIRTIAPGYAFLADQIRRSAHEVAATLDVMAHFGVLDSETLAAGHDLCDHLIAMLRRFR